MFRPLAILAFISLAQVSLADQSMENAVGDFAAICVNEMPSVVAANKVAVERSFEQMLEIGTPHPLQNVADDVARVSGAEDVLTKRYGEARAFAFFGAGRSSIGSGERSSNCFLVLFLSHSENVQNELTKQLKLGRPTKSAITSGMAVKLWDVQINGFSAFIRLSETLDKSRAKSFDLALFVFD